MVWLGGLGLNQHWLLVDIIHGIQYPVKIHRGGFNTSVTLSINGHLDDVEVLANNVHPFTDHRTVDTS